MTIIEIPAELGVGWWQWRHRVKRDPCVYCGVKASRRKATIEHIIPRRHGGEDEPHNIAGACHDCNTRKSQTSLLLWLLERH